MVKKNNYYKKLIIVMFFIVIIISSFTVFLTLKNNQGMAYDSIKPKIEKQKELELINDNFEPQSVLEFGPEDTDDIDFSFLSSICCDSTPSLGFMINKKSNGDYYGVCVYHCRSDVGVGTVYLGPNLTLNDILKFLAALEKFDDITVGFS